MRLWALTLGLVVGCSADKDDTTSTTTTTTTTSVGSVDADNDGHPLPGDCNDNDPTVYPGADDPPYDGVDSDCAGDPDDDVDGDGYVFDGVGGTDCNDNDPQVHPYAPEVCNGIDDDCDGTDDGPDADGAVSWYADSDSDTYGDPLTEVIACDAPADYVDNNGDCNDADPLTYAGAADVVCDGIDNDCDPLTFEPSMVTLDGVPAPSLGAAVSAAGPDAVIALCEGYYPVDVEPVVVTERLSIVGLNAAAVVVDAVGSGAVIEVDTQETVNLSGLTLTGGIGRAQGNDRSGGGMYVRTGGDVVGTDLWVTGNASGQGSGIYLDNDALLTLIASTVSNNHGDQAFAIVDSGGGIYAEDGAAILLDGSAVDGNTALSCGGISLGRDGVLDGSATSSVSGNATTGLAGGGVCALWDSRISNVTIANNASDNAAGGVDAVDTVLEGLTIEGNFSNLSGGGLYVWGISSLTDCIVVSNVGDIDGGGLSTFGSDTVLTIRNSVFNNNVANFFAAVGGGVEMFQGTLVSIDTDWGDAGTDNAPNDISLNFSNTTFDQAGLGSFTCVDAGPGSTCL